MRSLIALLPLLSLAACGGAGPESAGSIAAPAGTSAGSGTGVSTGTGTTTPTTPANFLDLTAAKTFDAVGSFQSLSVVAATGASLYQGNAATVRAPSGSISYDPRDGIFSVAFTDTKAGIARTLRFQDPAHRTDTSPAYTYAEVPNLTGFNYLTALDTDERATFFYQRPGTSTTYVSLAGFVRTNVAATTGDRLTERGVMVFGDQTLRAQIPVSGTGTYNGGFLATMISGGSSTQWLNGTSTVGIDFGAGTMSLALKGTVGDAYINNTRVNDGVASGSTFTATAHGLVNLVSSGGFTGKFDSVTFTNVTTQGVTAVDFTSVNPTTNVAGASSVDGTFFGPNAVNVGGDFRVIGGVPNTRVDILGAFTGAKQ